MNAETATALLAREREQRVLDDILRRRETTVVVITGTVGSGKTTLLRWAHDRANELGWSTVPADAVDELSVGDDTDPRALLRYVAPAPVADSWTAPASAHGGDHVGAAAAHAVTTAADVGLWRKELEHRGPVVVLLDGYRPSEAFGRWFTGALLPEIRAHAIPVVLLITSEAADAEPVAALNADVTIEVGPLPPETMRRHIETRMHKLGLDAGEDELDTYVRYLSGRPELLDGLIRLFALSASGTAQSHVTRDAT